MTLIYTSIGRLVVMLVRRRFGRQLQLGAAGALALGLVAAYLLASRDVEEG